MKRLLSFFVLFYAVSIFGMGNDGQRSDDADTKKVEKKTVNSPFTPPRQILSPLKSPNPSRPVEKWTARVSLTEDVDILGEIAQSIAQVPAGGYIGAEDKYFRNHTIINALIEAKKRGVHVICCVGSGAQENKLKLLEGAGIEVRVFKNLHTKRYIMSEKWIEKPGNSEKDLGKCTLFVGSHNNSYVAPNHYEDMISYHDSEAFIKAYWDQQFHEEDDGNLPKVPLKETPRKRTITSSADVDSNTSKAARISTLSASSDQSDMLDITSLTFNAQSIVNAVKEVKKARPDLPVRCIFDRLALTQTELLDELEASGAQVNIYNPDAEQKVWGKFPVLQHRKTILRRMNSNTLAIVSTGNLTSQSNDEINHDSWHPMDPKMFDIYKQAHDALIQECESYADIKERRKLD